MRNNGLVSIGVGTWRRPRTTSLSILLLFSLCISQSDKHSIIKIALQSELEASLLLPDGRHVFFFGFCRYCWLLSWRVFRVFELHWLFNTSLIADSSISRAQLRADAWRLNLLAYFSAANLRSRQQHSQRRLVHSINIYGLARKETLHNHNFSQG